MPIVVDILKTGTHETEWFMPRPPLDLKNTLDRLLIENITADAVYRISGVADNRAVAQVVHNLTDQTGLRIVRIERNNHNRSRKLRQKSS